MAAGDTTASRLLWSRRGARTTKGNAHLEKDTQEDKAKGITLIRTKREFNEHRPFWEGLGRSQGGLGKL